MSTTELTQATSRRRRPAEPSKPVEPFRSAAIETFILIVLAILLVLGIATSSGRSHAAQPTSRVHVDVGDTLWSIAVAHPVEGQTTQQTAEQIADMNGARQGVLTAGTTIQVPASGHYSTAVACR
jgi:LysM domain